MAGKTSTLVWDTPPDGGSDITEYRVLLFEDTTLVATLTSEDPMVDVEHSETVDRLALIQASNEQGYSAPLEFVIPPEPAGVSITLSGGGTLAATGTVGGSTPGHVPPTITVTDITDTGFTVNRTDPGSGYASYELVVLVSGQGEDGSQRIPNATFPYLVTGLTPGTEYLTGILITLADGSEDQSNLVSPTTTGTAPTPSVVVNAPQFHVGPANPWTHTLTAGATGVLVFLAGYGGADSGNVFSSVTYGGASMSYLSGGEGAGATSRRLYAFYLANPPAGDSTVAWTGGSSVNLAGGFSVDIVAGSVTALAPMLSTGSGATQLSAAYSATAAQRLVYAGIGRTSQPLTPIPANATTFTGSDGSNIQTALSTVAGTGTDQTIGFALAGGTSDALAILPLRLS